MWGSTTQFNFHVYKLIIKFLYWSSIHIGYHTFIVSKIVPTFYADKSEKKGKYGHNIK